MSEEGSVSVLLIRNIQLVAELLGYTTQYYN